MKQFIVQLAAGCPPTEGGPFAFSGNDNSCFGWRELEGLPLHLLGPTMSGMPRILIYTQKCQKVARGVYSSNCLAIPPCFLKLDFFFPGASAQLYRKTLVLRCVTALPRAQNATRAASKGFAPPSRARRARSLTFVRSPPAMGVGG